MNLPTAYLHPTYPGLASRGTQTSIWSVLQSTVFGEQYPRFKSSLPSLWPWTISTLCSMGIAKSTSQVAQLREIILIKRSHDRVKTKAFLSIYFPLGYKYKCLELVPFTSTLGGQVPRDRKHLTFRLNLLSHQSITKVHPKFISRSAPTILKEMSASTFPREAQNVWY